MSSQTIQYKPNYYIHISDRRDIGFSMVATITAQHSPSGYGGEQLGTFKSVRSAQAFIRKVIAERELDCFIHGYITCALWSSHDWSEDVDNPAPLDENYSVDDIAPETMAQIKEDCKDFVHSNKSLLTKYYKAYKPTQGYNVQECAGDDFWLTRNGHGAGFWDRGLGKLGDDLTEACKAFGECDLYVGDDGKIYAQ